MQINSINNQQNYTPNFQATIKINKGNLSNIMKDVGDSASMTTSSASIVPSGVVEATVFPMEAGGIGLAKPLKFFVQQIKNRWNKILGRPIKPATIEGDTTALKNANKLASAESSASAMLSTGAGSYTAGAASFMDQTVHYPTLGSDMIPEGAIKWMRDNDLQDWAYDVLYNEKGIGNESASSSATTAMGAGSFFHSVGSAGIAAPKKFIKSLSEAKTEDLLS